ncbi:MAG: hypothetical protein ABMA13_23955, partial [Chthoniobacteraceae bacterium]
MSEITLQLYASTTLEKFVGSDGNGEPELPTLKLGDTIKAQLRTFDTSTGQPVEIAPNVRTLNAAIGKVIEPPTRGEVMLKLGDDGDPFGPITVGTTKEELLAIFNDAVLGVTCEEVETDLDVKGVLIPCLWLLRFDADDPLDAIKTAVNKMRPESFARWRPFQIGDVWWHELRLIQAPLAFIEDPAARVLPPAPSVRQIRAGGASDYSDPLNPILTNEIQALTIPVIGFANPFAGTYVLRWRGRESHVLGVEDGPEQIASALDGMFSDGKTRFLAQLPIDNEIWIEFVGPAGETDWTAQPITVAVQTFKPGLLTFELSLDRAQMHSALRVEASIVRELEIELEVVGDDEDPEDIEVIGRPITFKVNVTILREQIWKELATIQTINWLRPPTPRDYIPFTADQILVGNQATYVAAIGDGEARSFSLPHNLGSMNGVFSLRENSVNGRMLLPDEYTLRFASADELIVDFPAELDPPEINAYIANFTAAGPASAFQAHTHTIE